MFVGGAGVRNPVPLSNVSVWDGGVTELVVDGEGNCGGEIVRRWIGV